MTLSDTIAKADTDHPITVVIIGAGHGGGDFGLIRDFVEAVAHKDSGRLSSSIKDSIESHVMGFAAEKSRKSNSKVDVKA